MTLEEQLRASVELIKSSDELRAFVKTLQLENAGLRRELGRARLIADLRSDFDLSADSTPALLRPQA